MNVSIKIIISLWLAMFALALFGNSVLAAESIECPGSFKILKIKLNKNLPGLGKSIDNLGTDKGRQVVPIDCFTLSNYISYIYNFAIGIVGLLSVFMVTVGGLQWLFSSGSPQKVQSAKETIVGAIMGLLIAIFSYTILNIVNPNILKLKPVKLPNMVILNDYCDMENNSVKFKAIKDNDGKSLVGGNNIGKIFNKNETYCGQQYEKIIDGQATGNTCLGSYCKSKKFSCLKMGKDTECVENIWNIFKKKCQDINDNKDDVVTDDQFECDKKINKYLSDNQAYFKPNDSCVWVDYRADTIFEYGSEDPFTATINLVFANDFFVPPDKCEWCPDYVYNALYSAFGENASCKANDNTNLKCTDLIPRNSKLAELKSDCYSGRSPETSFWYLNGCAVRLCKDLAEKGVCRYVNDFEWGDRCYEIK